MIQLLRCSHGDSVTPRSLLLQATPRFPQLDRDLLLLVADGDIRLVRGSRPLADMTGLNGTVNISTTELVATPESACSVFASALLPIRV